MTEETMPLTIPRSLLAHTVLPASAKLLYAVLKHRVGLDGTVRIDKTWLARQIGLDRRQVFTLLKMLETHRLVEIHRDESTPHYYSFPSAA
jgi:hypothetical protein